MLRALLLRARPPIVPALRRPASLASPSLVALPPRRRRSSNIASSGSAANPFRSHVCSDVAHLETAITTQQQQQQQQQQQCVRLAGWLQHARRVSSSLVFLVLRDHSGTMQLVVEGALAERLTLPPLESVVSIEGVPRARPAAQQRDGGGALEVVVSTLSVLNTSALPFASYQQQSSSSSSPSSSASSHDSSESVQELRNRHLTLRRDAFQRRLRFRSELSRRIHEHLYSRGFMHVETPTLFRPTPEGAREFLVPTRQGLFYSLVQSPQQFKQLLVAGGVNKYFQMARCYRDEDSRADRQPEFTQFDMELAFTNEAEIMSLIESLMQACWPLMSARTKQVLATPFEHVTYADAMRLYGVDKPDLRFDFSIVDVKSLFPVNGANLPFLNAARSVRALRIPALGNLSRSEIASLGEASGSARELAVLQFGEDGVWHSSLKNLAPSDLERLVALAISCGGRHGAPSEAAATASGDVLVVSWRDDDGTHLGRARTSLIQTAFERGLRPRCDFAFAWIVDFPLFERGEDGRLVSVHHPFTAPDVPLAADASNALALRGRHYDLVLNGSEIAGGSIRVHEAAQQRLIFEKALGLSGEEMQRFAHLLRMLESGCPPHGGIAIGFDRFTAVLLGCKSIRDVLAFPKTATGRDLMVDAPAAISDAELKAACSLARAPTA